MRLLSDEEVGLAGPVATGPAQATAAPIAQPPAPRAPSGGGMRLLSDEEVGLGAAAQPAPQAPGILAQLGREFKSQYLGAARDAAQSAYEGSAAISDFVVRNLFGDEAADKYVGRPYQLPEVERAPGVISNLGREGIRIGIGAVPINRALGAAGMAAGGVRSGLSGLLADFGLVGGKEEGISDIVQDVAPNPVTAALAKREGESELTGRLKNAAEGLLLGELVEAGLRGLGRVTDRLRGATGDEPTAQDLLDAAAAGDEEAAQTIADPQVRAILEAQGVDLTNANAERFAARVQARLAREGDPVATTLQAREAAEQSTLEGGAPVRQRRGRAAQAANELAREIDALRAEADALAAGEIDPAAARLPQRKRTPDVIRVGSGGTAVPFTAEGAVDPNAIEGLLRRGRMSRNLPVPVEPQPTRMSPEQIAQAQAQMRQPRQTETPPRLVAPEDRAPRTPDQVQAEREASEAFRLAERQRRRLAARPGTRDTRAAGRPQGTGERPVFLDKETPVQILDRRLVENEKGETVQVATVREFDPRTGRPVEDAVEYEIPVKQLRQATYAKQPRRAQEFVEAARSPLRPELPRTADQAVRRERAQTFRTTAPDPNEDFPGASSGAIEGRGRGAQEGRSPFPEQAEEPLDLDESIREPAPPRAPSKPAVEAVRGPVSGRSLADAPPALAWTVGPPTSGRGRGEKFGAYKLKPEDRRWFEGVVEQILTSRRGYIMPRIDPQAEAMFGPGSGMVRDWRNEIISEPGNAPEWFKKSGWTRKQVEKVAEKIRAGKPLGRQEARLAEDLVNAGREMREENVRQMVQARADRVWRRAREVGEEQARTELVSDIQARQRWIEENWRPDEAEDTTVPDILDTENVADDIPDPFGEPTNAATRDTDTGAGPRDAGGRAGEAGADQRPGDDSGASGTAGGPDRPSADDGPRRPSVERTPEGQQFVLPGAERTRPRADTGPTKGKVEQRGVDGTPLFDEGSRDTTGDLFKELTDTGRPPVNARGAKFTSGIDPVDAARMIRDMIRDLGFDVDMDFMRGFMRGAVGVASDLWKFTKWGWQSNAAYLKGLAIKYDSPTLRNLADMFHAPPGAGRAVKETFHEAVDKRSAQNLDKLQKVLSALERRGITREVYDPQLRDLLVNPRKNKGETDIEKAALVIQKMLKDELDYRRAAGEDIGEVRYGYFPRIVDMDKVAKKPEEFKERLRALYRRYGAEDPTASAQSYYDKLVQENMGLDQTSIAFEVSPLAVARNAELSRKFGKEADEVLKEFYFDDVASALSAYFTGSARRAEFVRRFGKKGAVGSKERAEWERQHGNKTQLDVMKDQIIEEVKASGKDAEDVLKDISKIVMSNLGTLGASTAMSVTRRTASFLHTWNIVSVLDRNLLTSAGELAMAGMRTGSVKLAFKGVMDGLNEFVRAMLKLSPTEAREWAESLGVVNDAIVEMMQQSRISGMVETRGQRKVLANFFKGLGVHQFTEGTRVANLKIGRQFIKQLARDAKRATGAKGRRIKFYLAELGIDDPAGFAKWMEERNWEPTLEEIVGATGGFAKDYSTALTRFVEQTILKPNRAHKPRWANHPAGSLFYGLASYSYAFKKQVLDRQYELARRALGAQEESQGLFRDLANAARLENLKKLKDADPAYLSSLAVGLPLLLGIHYVMDTHVRGPLLGKDYKDESFSDFLMRLAERSGLTAGLSPYVNAVTGIKYERDLTTSLSGPAIGRIATALESFATLVSDANSPNTDSAEYAALGQLYDVAIEPLLDALVAGNFSRVARTAGLYATGNATDREWFMNTMGEAFGLERRGSNATFSGGGRQRSRTRSRSRSRSRSRER